MEIIKGDNQPTKKTFIDLMNEDVIYPAGHIIEVIDRGYQVVANGEFHFHRLVPFNS